MKRSLLILTLLAAAGVAVLAGLGFWQLQRLSWKEALIERVEQRVDAPPVTLAEARGQWDMDGDVEYLPVRLSGVFDHARERHFYTVVRSTPGWRIITPLRTDGDAIVMVDRGFVPDKLKEASTREQGQLEGTVALSGLARGPGQPNAFTPDSDLERNQWYWRDLKGMASSVLTETEQSRVVPFFIEASASDVPGGWPRGGLTRVTFDNRHLEYAMTWFGLAAGLVAVFAAFVFRSRKQREFT